VVATALVNSPNGLWLRESPGGTQEVELIPDGSVLILLPGREVANDSEWQQVRTQAGNEGWVAVDFIIYQ
jgi:SH3-like domain-containing protein